MVSGNLPPQRREIVATGDINCSTDREPLLFGWMKWAMRNMRKSEIKVLVWLRKISKLLSHYSSLRTVWSPIPITATSWGTWVETVDIFSCDRCLSDQFVPTQQNRKYRSILNRLWRPIFLRSQKRSSVGVQSPFQVHSCCRTFRGSITL